jgi:hypothetical protein
MGADGHHGFDTRSVWSPSGGWYADPRGWRRNTVLAYGAVAVVSYFVASYSAKLEVRVSWRPARGWGGGEGREPRVAFAAAHASPARTQQRPLAPVRPIPSQRWCDNFPKEEAEANKR